MEGDARDLGAGGGEGGAGMGKDGKVGEDEGLEEIGEGGGEVFVWVRVGIRTVVSFFAGLGETGGGLGLDTTVASDVEISNGLNLEGGGGEEDLLEEDFGARGGAGGVGTGTEIGFLAGLGETGGGLGLGLSSEEYVGLSQGARDCSGWADSGLTCMEVRLSKEEDLGEVSEVDRLLGFGEIKGGMGLGLPLAREGGRVEGLIMGSGGGEWDRVTGEDLGNAGLMMGGGGGGGGGEGGLVAGRAGGGEGGLVVGRGREGEGALKGYGTGSGVSLTLRSGRLIDLGEGGGERVLSLEARTLGFMDLGGRLGVEVGAVRPETNGVKVGLKESFWVVTSTDEMD